MRDTVDNFAPGAPPALVTTEVLGRAARDLHATGAVDSSRRRRSDRGSTRIDDGRAGSYAKATSSVPLRPIQNWNAWVAAR